MIERKTIEITVFAGFNEVDVKELAYLKKIGCQRCIIGLDNEDDDRKGLDRSDYFDSWELRPQLRGGRLERSYERLQNEGILCGAHYWMRPMVKWEEEAQAKIIELAKKYGGPEFTAMSDIEYFAHKMSYKRAGFDSWEAVVEWWNAHWSPPPSDGQHPWWPKFTVAVFPFPNHRSEPLARCSAVQEVTPMTYGNRKHWHGDPRTLLERSIREWREVLPSTTRLVQGMGAFSQARGDRSEYKVMMDSGRFVAKAGIDGVAYWQLETIDGGNAVDQQRRRAIKGVGRMQVGG